MKAEHASDFYQRMKAEFEQLKAEHGRIKAQQILAERRLAELPPMERGASGHHQPNAWRESSAVHQWLSVCCVADAEAVTLTADAWRSFIRWSGGLPVLTRRAFTDETAARGFPLRVLSRNRRAFAGLALESSGDARQSSSPAPLP